MSLTAIAFAWFGQWKDAKHRENRAANEILNRGGSVGYFNGWEIERRAWLVRGLSLILPRDCLYTAHSVYLDRADDSKLAPFVHLPHLRNVHFKNCRFSESGLQNLSGLTGLEFLQLDDTPLSDAGLAHLQGIRRLDHLFLSNTQITDASLPWIARNRRLTHLSLGGTAVTDEGVALLTDLSELECLALRDTSVTPRVTETLRRLPKLKYLYLTRTEVDDSTVPDLCSLTGLYQLDIRQTKITAAGQQLLRAALPRCTIELSELP